MSQDPLSPQAIRSEAEETFSRSSGTSKGHKASFMWGLYERMAIELSSALREIRGPLMHIHTWRRAYMEVELPVIACYRLCGGSPPQVDDYDGGDPGDPLHIEDLHIVVDIKGHHVDLTPLLTRQSAEALRAEIVEAVLDSRPPDPKEAGGW